MQVYQVIKNCSITYIENGQNVGFALFVGDYFFIDKCSHWVQCRYTKHKDVYIKENVLVKIYYNKMINFDGDYKWTWVDNINIINPLLNVKINNYNYDIISVNDFDNNESCKNITIQWERNEKLKQITEN